MYLQYAGAYRTPSQHITLHTCRSARTDARSRTPSHLHIRMHAVQHALYMSSSHVALLSICVKFTMHCKQAYVHCVPPRRNRVDAPVAAHNTHRHTCSSSLPPEATACASTAYFPPLSSLHPGAQLLSQALRSSRFLIACGVYWCDTARLRAEKSLSTVARPRALLTYLDECGRLLF
eukprot:6194188-Pleurochrysis_carterae.AAC.7